MKEVKKKVIKELVSLGCSSVSAKDLLEEHISIVQVNVDVLTPKELAQQIMDEHLQHYKEED